MKGSIIFRIPVENKSGNTERGIKIKDKPIITIDIGIKSRAERKLNKEYLLKKYNAKGKEIIEADRDADINSFINPGSFFKYGRNRFLPAVIPADSEKVKIKPGSRISRGLVKRIKIPANAMTL